MSAPLDETAVKEEVAAEFRAIEEAAPPGILDLVQVYGDYAAAAQQATVYLALLAPAISQPISSNSSNSSTQ